MSCSCECDCGGDGICRCDDRRGPLKVYNPSGLPAISYRVGDYTSFRHDLVRHDDGEEQLAVWHPTAHGDLALQVVDWWAYVADVLTFYNERIANEAYLGTAVLPQSVRRLVAALGYRPRPGIGAVATLGVIASRRGPLALPDRFAVASKGTPALASQTFELTTGTTFQEPTSVDAPPPEDLGEAPPEGGPPQGAKPGTAEPPPHDELIAKGGVLVKGKATVSVGDRLLLVKEPGDASKAPEGVVVTVTGIAVEKDPHKRSNTRVLLSGTGSLGSGAKAKDYKLKRATRTSHLVTVPSGASVVGSNTLVLDGTARFLKAGDPLLVELPGAGDGASPAAKFDLVRLTAYREEVWYANVSPPTTSSPPDNAIPLVVAELTVAASRNLSNQYSSHVTEVAVRAGWTDVGTLLDTPVTRLSGLPAKVTLARPPAASAGVATPGLLEDANGNGAPVTATPIAGTSEVSLSSSAEAKLEPPLRLLWDLVTVTRGASVRDEQLGTGDATQAGQDFSLAKKPVTYLADGVPGPGAPPSRSGDGYSSTVEFVVDGVRWREVPTLFGRGPAERVFSTYEDDEGKTHVVTGDGVNGKRLRTGAAVSASYRTGAGWAVPAAGAITQILSTVPNLSAVRNPVPAGGGSDPDPPDQLRAYAPRSVLTFGRAVSGDDYAALAVLAPGVTRASAAWSWDPAEQRAMVCVYVGDDAAAVDSAREALREESDPNRPVVVVRATARTAWLSLILELDPAYMADDVVAEVRSALLDSPHGLFAPGVLRIGETLYRSRIEASCDVPGVLAVHAVRMRWKGGLGRRALWLTGTRFSPGEGGYFDVASERLVVSTEVASGE